MAGEGFRRGQGVGSEGQGKLAQCDVLYSILFDV